MAVDENGNIWADVYVRGLWPEDEEEDEGWPLPPVAFVYIPRPGDEFIVRREFGRYEAGDTEALVRAERVLQVATAPDAGLNAHPHVFVYCVPANDAQYERLRNLFPNNELH